VRAAKACLFLLSKGLFLVFKKLAFVFQKTFCGKGF